MVADIELETV
jgi:hypothetical protein